MQLELAVFLERRDPSAAESMLRTLETSRDIHVAAMAQQQLASLESTRQLGKAPLDLKFKAVDGTDVDVAKLRGKVVLVDFWATWCGPCRMEMPNVVATYNQLHKAGFEIVGISLDQSKEKLLGYTQQAGMTWPEYFDGKGWGNDISSRYGINSIPAAWLVDKKGLVRTTQARGANLAEQVKALLAE
jgi:thiol-disulfide isomerase/thioredoxin